MNTLPHTYNGGNGRGRGGLTVHNTLYHGHTPGLRPERRQQVITGPRVSAGEVLTIVKALRAKRAEWLECLVEAEAERQGLVSQRLAGFVDGIDYALELIEGLCPRKGRENHEKM